MYIGFGSLLVDNRKGLTKMILSAAQRTGQRIILCRCAALVQSEWAETSFLHGGNHPLHLG